MSRLIVTLGLGEPTLKMLEVSAPFMREYAEKIGADFRIIQEPKIFDGGMPLYEKCQVGELLNDYERIAFFDADVIVNRWAPDLFALVPADAFGSWNELESTDHSGMADELEQMFGPPRFSGKGYFCTGLFVVSRKHRDLFHLDPLQKARIQERGYWNEQFYLNWRLNQLDFPRFCLPDLLHWCPVYSYVPEQASIVHFWGHGFPRPNDSPIAERVERKISQLRAYLEHQTKFPGLGWFPPRPFLSGDVYWTETADFLRDRLGAEARLMAPAEFSGVFPWAIPFDAQRQTDFARLDALVIHKGMFDEIQPSTFAWLAQHAYPAFANEVFAIYFTRPVHEIIGAPHFEPVQLGPLASLSIV